MQRQYALGFIFTEDRQQVLLIKKNRPLWQAGLLNGVGGKLEGGEHPQAAMKRELQEETGLILTSEQLEQFAKMTSRDGGFAVYVYRAFYNRLYDARSMTDEIITITPVHIVRAMRAMMIDNLQWLIPLALDTKVGKDVTIDYHHSTFADPIPPNSDL